MKIVFASHTYLSSVFVVGSQQLARILARAGHTVWHLSAALSVAHLPFALFNRDYRIRARLALLGSRLVEPGLWESVPLTLAPWSVLRRIPNPERHYLRGFRAIKKTAQELGFDRPDLLLLDEPRLSHVLTALAPRVAVYRPTDIYCELKGDPTLRDVERRLLARVNGVVATSAPVLAHVQSLGADAPALLLENGVDVAHFAAAGSEPRDLASIPRPRAIYVGAVDARFDADLLHDVAAKIPALNFVVIGGDAPRTGKLSRNVYYLGRRPYRDVPAYLRASDLAVMPLKASAANDGRSPMKIFEFGAAGLAVVASATTELRRRNLPFVRLADSGDEFARLCSGLIDGAANGAAEALRKVARDCAAEHSWQSKTERLLDFTQSLPERLAANL
jgi:glycosyltransferase involved in cell wall biosynthesis